MNVHNILRYLAVFLILPFLSNSVKPGVRFREIGEVINRHASMSGFSVVTSSKPIYLVFFIHTVGWLSFVPYSYFLVSL